LRYRHGYGFIDRVEFNLNEGLVLHCGRQTIKIKGRNLNSEGHPRVRLFQPITTQRVPWIAEADRPAILQAGKHRLIVESIEW
jgi:hypothetical protein